MKWLDGFKARPVAEVAPALGLSERAGTFAPCPSCGAERRGSSDPRGPVGTTGNGAGWRCHRCDAGGSVVDLAAVALLGSAPAGRWPELLEALIARGLVDPPEDRGERGTTPAAGRTRDGGPPTGPPGPGPAGSQRPSPDGCAPSHPLRPPPGEVADLWYSCGPAVEDAEVSAWLTSRGLEAARLAGEVAALPPPPWPAWCVPSMVARRRAVLPAWDARGALVSLRFRAVDAIEGPKAIPPNGRADPRTGGAAYAVGGSVLACIIGRAILNGSASPPGWDGRVVIAEGEPDFLTWVHRLADLEQRPAVFGVWSGGWTAEIGARLPARSEVVLRVDHDAEGDKYAAKILATLAHCRRVARSRSPMGTT